MPITAVSHVSITVSDLNRSERWYAEVLGWSKQATGRSDTTTFAYGLLPGDVAIVLRQHDVPESSGFDERRPGLDHLSFAVAELDDLASVEAILQSRGDPFTPVMAMPPHGHQLTFRDPDGVALELMHME